MKHLAVFSAVALAACGAATPTSTSTPTATATPTSTPTPTWKILYDSASPPTARPVPPGDARHVLARLARPDCSNVGGGIPGAYESKGAQQTAYLVTCGAGRRIVVLEGDRVAASVGVVEDTLVDVGDLDGDGDSELLAVGSEGARLFELDGGVLVPVYDFAAAAGSCSRRVITARSSGRGLEFHVETTPAVCPKLSLEEHAAKLHRESIVIDAHDDITSAILEDGFDLGKTGTERATDLAKMRAGGISGEFFSIYVDKGFYEHPTSLGGGSARRALDMIDVTYQQLERHPQELVLATSVDEIRGAKQSGKIAVLMGIEGGHAIENSLYALRDFYRLGVRYMTLTHVNNNDWADASGLTEAPKPAHHGLSPFGEDVVREMQRIGMLVDVSHVSDETFEDVMRVAKAPVIASHSSSRALCNLPRNMSDDEMRAMAKNGGVVMVNFFPGFLDPKYSAAQAAFRAKHAKEIAVLMRKHPKLSELRAAMAKMGADQLPTTPMAVLVDHIEHVAKVAGVDHVGLGSDFDGVPALPDGMTGLDCLPKITLELLKRGWADEDVKKVLGENFLRVMSEAEAYARSTKTMLSADGSTKKIDGAP